MLPADQRVRKSAEYAAVVRSGRRTRSGAVMVYLLAGDRPSAPAEHAGLQPTVASARAGLIVGKPVGNSVVRHRVSRRLREQLRSRLSSLSSGDMLVVRALPAAAEQTSSSLGRDLDSALDRIAGRGRVRR